MNRSAAFALGALAFAALTAQVALQLPMDQMVIKEQPSADAVASYVFTLPNGSGNATRLRTLSVKIGDTSGYIMVFNATAIPSNGAVTPIYCMPVYSNGTNGWFAAEWSSPMQPNTDTPLGIVAAISTTGCDTLTAATGTARGKFMGQAL